MNKLKSIKKEILIITLILQLIVVVFPILRNNYLLKTGESFKIEVTGYDPYDILRGRYIDYRLSNREIEVGNTIDKEIVNNAKVMYFEIDKELEITQATHLKPSHSNYISLHPKQFYYKNYSQYYDENILKTKETDKIIVDPDFKKYYVNEKVAPFLEDELRKSETKAYITLVVKNGKYLVKNMIINDVTY